MQFERMDRTAVRIINDEMRAALQDLAERFGLEMKVGGGSYDPDAGTFRPKVEFAIPALKLRAAGSDAVLLGLPADVIGKEIVLRPRGTARVFRVTGINLRAPRFPVLALDVESGKTFKFQAASILGALANT